jgi:hypothetical protein
VCNDVKVVSCRLRKNKHYVRSKDYFAKVMEQLAYFVTKSFEYSNTTNRVLEIIKMSAKFDEKSDKSDLKMTDESANDDTMDGSVDGSIDIDITNDNSSDFATKTPSENEEKNEKCDTKNKSDKSSATKAATVVERTSSPLPLIKKLNRDGSKHVTKNWLISDCPKKKTTETDTKAFISTPPSENQENSAMNLIRVDDLVAKKQQSVVRAKPVTELLKQIREINNLSPLHKNEKNFKVEIVEDEKIKTGE